MPKVVVELTALDVKRLTHPGGRRNVLFAVGGVPGLHAAKPTHLLSFFETPEHVVPAISLTSPSGGC